MPPQPPNILARGPWAPADVTVSWSDAPWEPSPDLTRQADAEVEALKRRSSPSHDGLAARLADWHTTGSGLDLELQPIRWALRLVDHPDTRSLTALCIVRDDDGRWLAGRRAEWLATWSGRWALGAGGAVEVGENPAATLTRELEEEWQLVPERVSVEALVTMPSGLAALIGVARVPNGANAVPDAEHDELAWWPADPDAWPDEADERLGLLARWLMAPR
ncbi:MAG: 8-oxo-dGTP diphosphatase [Thermoleophilaceae bacterium]|nr:8-oxo-dGTP diphosphatase [Thermoleophilaceae bacterium]